MEKATLAGGCFWCLEAIFQRLKGVVSALPGYTGGIDENPTYEKVYTGNTGHAECVHIIYDPTVISFEQILEVFFRLHDPTTLNRQGFDTGTQYRSAIFYNSELQKTIAKSVITRIQESGLYPNKIITQLEPFTKFYTAESSHHDYYNKNSFAPYCQTVIDPKIQELYKDFKGKLKNPVI